MAPRALVNLDRETAELVRESADHRQASLRPQLRAGGMLEHAAELANLPYRYDGAVVLAAAVQVPHRAVGAARRVRHDRMRTVVQPGVSRDVPAIDIRHLRIRAARVDVQRGDHETTS